HLVSFLSCFDASLFLFFFFFSSRRRHTRSLRDWSSDVCSSDLYPVERTLLVSGILDSAMHSHAADGKPIETPHLEFAYSPQDFRSEERRVGKECRSRGSR